MANIRIKDLTTQARHAASDDFYEIDGTTNASRKLSPMDAHGQFRNALAPRGGIAFDGTGSTQVYSTLTGQSVGADPVSFVAFLRVPTVVSGTPGIFAVTANKTLPDGSANTLFGYLNTSGHLNFRIIGASNSDRNNWVLNSVSANYGGKTVCLVVVRPSSGSIQVYINGLLQTATSDTTTGTPPTWQGSITSTYLTVGYVYNSEVWNDSYYSASLYNLALSAADCLEIYEAGGGVPERYKFGSQADVASGSLVVGKVYRVVGGTSVVCNGVTTAAGSTFTAGATTYTETGGTEAVYRVGAIIHMPGDDGGGLILRDASTNGLHVQMTATGVSHVRPLNGPFRVRRSSSTNGNEQLFGQVCIPANSQILRVRAKARTNTPTVTLGTASGGSQVVASVALTTAWKDLTIALTGGMVGGSNISLWAGSNSTDVVDWDVSWESLSA